MNFFTAGFVLACMQLDLGWGIGYIIKLVGGLFIVGGIYELSPFEKRIGKYRAFACAFVLVCAAAAAATLALAHNESSVLKFESIAAGLVTTAMAALFYRKLYSLLKERTDIVGDVPGVLKASAQYDRMLFVTILVLAADAVNRFTGGTSAADAAGVVMYFSKIVFYVYLVACGLSMNKLRVSFNSSHPAE